MQAAIEWFHVGGFWMWLILLLGLGALGAGILHATVASKSTLVVGATFIVGTVLAGMLGWATGRSAVDAALAVADPSIADELRRVGYEEASHPGQFGLGMIALPAILLVLGESRRQKPKRFS